MEENINSAFNAAKQYAQAAEILSQKNDDKLHLPAVLCSSFSIEILLKCVILIEIKNSCIDNRKFKEHKFTELYDIIKPQNKKIIVDQYRKIREDHSIDIERFRKLLQKNGDNAFVEWRYSFEKDYKERLQMIIDQKILADITNAIGKSVSILMNSHF